MRRFELPLLGSNQDSPDPESGVLPVTPRGSAAFDCHGAEGDRTPDLCSAIAALSQLSYSPRDPSREGAKASGRTELSQRSRGPQQEGRRGRFLSAKGLPDRSLERHRVSPGAPAASLGAESLVGTSRVTARSAGPRISWPMDLTSGTPLWPTLVGIPAAYPQLRHDRRCDVAVIGGGITGALVAHRFACEGIHVVLVEGREVARGSTAATTALIQYEIDTDLVDLIERVGADHAIRSYRLCLDAVRGIEALAESGTDGCGWRATRSLYLASRRRDRQMLERERLARRSAGIEVELLSERDIRDRFSFSRPAALLSPVAGEVDAYHLTHRLLAQAASAGLEVYDRSPVGKYLSEPDGVELHTAAGARVRARKAVFATGYETPEFLERSQVKLLSTYAFATEPLEHTEGW